MIEKELKKLFKKFGFLKKKTLPNGIECGAGWDIIVKDLFQTLADTNPPSDFAVIKVFSKLDELRVHTVKGNNNTRFAIDAAVERSSEVCEFCGNEKTLQQCDKCKDPEPVVENDINAILNPVIAIATAAAAITTSAPAPSTPATTSTTTGASPTVPTTP